MNPPNASLLLVMACFWAAYFVIDRFLLRPVGEVMAERQRRVEEAEATWSAKREEYRSATARLEAELDEAAREAARRREALRAEAERERSERLEAARAEASARLERALEELARDAETARTALREEAGRLAALMASKVLGREVAP